MVPTLVERFVLETITIKIQGRGTTLLLLVNPCISRQNNGTVIVYQLLSEKKTICCWLCSTHYSAVQINNCLKITK